MARWRLALPNAFCLAGAAMISLMRVARSRENFSGLTGSRTPYCNGDFFKNTTQNFFPSGRIFKKILGGYEVAYF